MTVVIPTCKENSLKRILSIIAVLALSLSGLILGASSANANADKPWICHPVNGNGETGNGWNLINPDRASKHIQNGVPKHTSKDGRSDTYAVNGVCPGTPVPTTSTTTPSSTTTTTPSVTTTTPSSTTTTSSSTTTSPSSTTSSSSTTTTGSSTTTTTTSTSPPTTKTTTSKPVVTTAPVVTTTPVTNTLPRTGVNAWVYVGIAFALLLSGIVLLYGKSLARRH